MYILPSSMTVLKKPASRQRSVQLVLPYPPVHSLASALYLDLRESGNEASGALTSVRDFEIWTLAKAHQTDAGNVRVEPKGPWEYSSDAEALDFLVEVEFVRPSGDDWSLGFLVRAVGSDRFDSVVVNGENGWTHEWLGSGDDPAVTDGAVTGELGDSVHLLLVGFGTVGLLFVDGELVSRLDLSGNLELGEVLLIGDTGDEIMGPMQFERFRLWVPG